MDNAALQASGREALAVLEQMVELRAVRREGGLEIEDLLERRLDRLDVLTDGDLAADLLP